MSNMQGNPQFEHAADMCERIMERKGNISVVQSMYDMAIVQANATLALAYETRTATLMAMWDARSLHVDGVYDRGNELAGVSYGAVAEQIKTRLGIGVTS